MINAVLTKRFTNLIHDAQKADEAQLKALRKKVLTAVNKFGARRFVTVTAEVLKNKFCIEGCNDARIPLKRIFNIPLDELDAEISNHKYDLPEGHPLSLLSTDHKESLGKLKMLRLDLGKINLNIKTPVEKIRDRLAEVKDYYRELDSHIRKEEEVLFPVLEKEGMAEHPENLREEHKKFKETLSEIIKIIEEAVLKGHHATIDEIGGLKEIFISNISNHIFRETYIFYPATLEFIKDKAQWEDIKKGFDSIKDNL